METRALDPAQVGSETRISLAQYAGVVVAVDAGCSLEAALAQERVPADAWEAIDGGFKDRLSRDGELLSEYNAYVEEAEDHLARSITPLDEDPAAYLCFVRQLAEADPGPLLDSHSLKLADVGRLGRYWGRRFGADSQLQARALERATNMRMPEIRVGAPALRPYRWTPGAQVEGNRDADPQRFVELAPLTIDPSRLPSAYGPKASWASAAVPPGGPVPAPQTTTPSSPTRTLEPTASLATTTRSVLTTLSPPTPFRGTRLAPPPVASSLEPHAELGATAPVGSKPPPPGATPFCRLEPASTLGETAPMKPGPRAPAMPFSGKRTPPRVLLEPHSDHGATATLPQQPQRPRRVLEPPLKRDARKRTPEDRDK